VTRLRWSYTRIAWLTVGLIVAVAAWRAYLLWSGEPWLRLYLAPSTRLDAPLVGSLVGVAYCAGWLPRVPKRVATTAAVVGLAAFLTAAFTIILDARVLYFGLYTVLALCGAAAIVGVVRAPGDRLAAVLSWRPLVFLGALSYSVYIWHYGIFYWFERHDPSWPGPVVLLVGNGVTLAVSWVSWRWIERPFLRLKSRRTVSVAATPV
jgi:peptidoglycan/LPS O-acetylase OafA/YrhL